MRLVKLLKVDNVFFVYDVDNVQLYEIDEKTALHFKNNPEELSNTFDYECINDLDSSQKPLTNIHLNVAQVCNLVCGYCYGIEGEYGLKGKMNEGNALKAIDYLIKNSKDERELEIVFFGGEPLLNFPLIQKVVAYCKKREKEIFKIFRFIIVTNGTKFSEEINSFLNQYDFSVTISFDGDKETQDKNRPFRGGKGSYENILPKIKDFLKTRDGNATARATITNHSKNLLEYRNNLYEIGFKNSFVESVTLSDYARKNYDIDYVSNEQTNTLLEYDKNEINEFLEAIKGKKSLRRFESIKFSIYLKQFLKKSKITQHCGVSTSMRGIAINGDVYPCHRFVGDNSFKVGNVNKEINGAEKDFFIDFVNTHPDCKNCFAKYYCGGGGCIHNNYIKNGDIQTLDKEHCRRMHNKIKLLFKFYYDLSVEDRLFLINELNLDL